MAKDLCSGSGCVLRVFAVGGVEKRVVSAESRAMSCHE